MKILDKLIDFKEEVKVRRQKGVFVLVNVVERNIYLYVKGKIDFCF